MTDETRRVSSFRPIPGQPVFGTMSRVRDLLRSVWNEPRAPHPPARVWRDWALVAVFVPAAMLEGILRTDLAWRPVALLIGVALVTTLLRRRTHPLLMVVISFGAVTVLSLASFLSFDEEFTGLGTMVYLLLLPYSLFRWGSGREAAIGLPIMLVAASLDLLYGYTPVAEALGGYGVLFFAMALGAALRYHASAHVRELDHVKLVEREQLARDLHDTVAHHVSAIAIRAQAGLATAAISPNAATDALRVIEAEASRTLTEMRAMVRLLRRGEPVDLAPSRGLADLRHLAHADTGGPQVDVEINGDLDDLPASVSAAIYRLAQESVTNAQRHAKHASRIEVRVDAAGERVQLRVSDDGDLSLVRAAPPPGYGIIGMIERASLLGGTCKVGPNPDRGWTMTAVLPRNDSRL